MKTNGKDLEQVTCRVDHFTSVLVVQSLFIGTAPCSGLCSGFHCRYAVSSLRVLLSKEFYPLSAVYIHLVNLAVPFPYGSMSFFVNDSLKENN